MNVRKVYRRRARLRLALVVAVAVLISLVSASPAFARTQQSQCGATTNYKQGQSTVIGGSQPTAIEGALAQVVDGGGWLICLSDTNGNVNFDTTWVMAQAAHGYSQSGLMYRYGYGSCIKIWAQQAEPGIAAVDAYLGGCSNQGDSRMFWNDSAYIGTTWHMRANVDSTNIRMSTTSPFTWTLPFYATYESEVYHLASNISGSSSYHTKYTNMKVQRYSDNVFVTACGNSAFGTRSGPSPFNLSVTSCNSQETWTA